MYSLKGFHISIIIIHDVIELNNDDYSRSVDMLVGIDSMVDLWRVYVDVME